LCRTGDSTTNATETATEHSCADSGIHVFLQRLVVVQRQPRLPTLNDLLSNLCRDFHGRTATGTGNRASEDVTPCGGNKP
jgi:hypothetical protein